MHTPWSRYFEMELAMQQGSEGRLAGLMLLGGGEMKSIKDVLLHLWRQFVGRVEPKKHYI